MYSEIESDHTVGEHCHFLRTTTRMSDSSLDDDSGIFTDSTFMQFEALKEALQEWQAKVQEWSVVVLAIGVTWLILDCLDLGVRVCDIGSVLMILTVIGGLT